MFESDDFDQVLSQLDFPEVAKAGSQEIVTLCTEANTQEIDCTIEYGTIKRNTKEPNVFKDVRQQTKTANNNLNKDTKLSGENPCGTHVIDNFISPKHLKRKIISSHFDQQRKRKFPGPAGLLTGVLEETNDESIGQIEFLSQDMDFTENNLHRDLFESPLWKRLLSDIKDWNVKVDSIKAIKQQALAGNLRERKAQTVTAFIEAVDRSVIDPLIILRDETGSIKCTLHRDAWSKFSPYIVSECCALVLQKPTVLTTGGAFKKHYLNITLSNILAIFSSSVLKEEKEDSVLPDGYRIMYEEDFTVIKTEICSDNLETNSRHDGDGDGDGDIFDGLDTFFSFDETF